MQQPRSVLTARARFVEAALEKKGAVVVWGGLDCSELVAIALLAAGGPDTRATYRAQTFADKTPRISTLAGAAPIPGDLAFYGADWQHVIHVGVHVDDGAVLSADGATSHVTDLAVATANLLARVHLHPGPKFRRDYLGSSRSTFLDDLDRVTR